MDQMLTSLRESIIDKSPLTSGTLQVSDSYLSLFYKTAREGHNARLVDLHRLRSFLYLIDIP